VGVGAYVVAVLQRTSLGVAGIEAASRFSASASVLALFAVLQLLVYAALQVPVGVLLDRYGAKRLILSGAVLLGSGQTLLAFATTLPAAIGSRMLIGAGDAFTFVCVLRLVAAWFPPQRVPVMTQLTGLTGQLGQILAAAPLGALLATAGWTPTYLTAAAASAVVFVLVLAVLQNRPPGVQHTAPAPGLAQVATDVGDAFRHPGTRLGLWSHFTSQSSGMVFGLIWGYPFLVSGQGLSPQRASALLTLFVVAGMACAPVLGHLVSRHPLRRSWLVLGILAATVGSWTLVLGWPGRAPLWTLVLLVLALSLNGPGGMIGFDFARTFNPSSRLGSATGIVNVGGFTASLLTILAIGAVLDAAGAGGGVGRAATYDLDAFKLAWCVQYAVWAFGLVGILRTRTLARARMERDDGVVVPPMREAVARRIRSRRG
jgi:MFS family permease